MRWLRHRLDTVVIPEGLYDVAETAESVIAKYEALSNWGKVVIPLLGLIPLVIAFTHVIHWHADVFETLEKVIGIGIIGARWILGGVVYLAKRPYDRIEAIAIVSELPEISQDLDAQARLRGSRVDVFALARAAGWTSPELNHSLLKRSGGGAAHLAFNVKQKPWQIPKTEDHARLLRYAKAQARSRDQVLVDDEKVRLCEDIDPFLRKPVTVQKSRYFNSVTTDGYAFHRVMYGGPRIQDMHQINIGLDGFLSKETGSYGLKSVAACSAMANQLGVSCLAFSQDGYLMLVEQRSANFHSADMIAPTGSGSLDWSDVGEHLGESFLHVIKRAATRELFEETGLGAIENLDIDEFARDDMLIYGFSRIIQRGGKPEFFCVARLPRTCDAMLNDVQPTGTERRLSRQCITNGAMPLETARGFADELKRVCSFYTNSHESKVHSSTLFADRHRLSYQVLHGLLLLEECTDVRESREVLGKFLGFPAAIAVEHGNTQVALVRGGAA